jgi:hypothetical protein
MKFLILPLLMFALSAQTRPQLICENMDENSSLAVKISESKGQCPGDKEFIRLALVWTGAGLSKPVLFCANGGMEELIKGEMHLFEPKVYAINLGFTDQEIKLRKIKGALAFEFIADQYFCEIEDSDEN